MICIAILALIVGAVLGAPTEDLPNLRIIGGQKANQESFKYQVSILHLGNHTCGGTLISTNIVITAAHCTQESPPNYFQVRVGSQQRQSGGKVYNVEDYVSHSEYNLQHHRSDVAVMKLFEHVQLGKNVDTLELTNEEPKANAKALVSGWGYTKEEGPLSDDLLFIEVPIMDRSECLHHRFSKEMICAGKIEGGIDACQGDSGGPLVVNKKLAGIISWGRGCARPDQFGFYTNVAYMRPWIDKAIEQLIGSK